MLTLWLRFIWRCIYDAYDMAIWRCMLFIGCDIFEKLLCMLFEFYWRRDIYFLNICIFRVFYRFNKSRALQVGIKAMLVLSKPELGEFPVCMRMVPSIFVMLLCPYLLVWFCVEVRWVVVEMIWRLQRLCNVLFIYLIILLGLESNYMI